MRLAFDLAGTCLHVTAPRDFDLSGLLLLVGRLATDPRQTTDFEIIVRLGAHLGPPADWPMVWQGRLPEGAEAEMREADNDLELRIPGRLVMRAEPHRRRVAILCAPGGESLAGGTAGVLAVDAALASGGQRLVHGAALRLPGGDGAILIAAPSGAGKTTAALALARGGFALYGDDAAVLVEGAGGVCLWGLPRAVKLHRRTVALLPWLGPIAGRFGVADERMVPIERLAAAVPLSPAGPARLAAILVLGRRSDGPSLIRPLARADAIIAVARDNVLRGDGGLGARASRRFAAIARAVAAAPAYGLSVGADLAALPELVEAVVAPTAPAGAA